MLPRGFWPSPFITVSRQIQVQLYRIENRKVTSLRSICSSNGLLGIRTGHHAQEISPCRAFGDAFVGICQQYANRGGVLSGSSSGLSLSDSIVFMYAGTVGSNLGSLNFTTGAFTRRCR